MSAVLALDQGTSQNKALVVRPDGSVAASCEVRVSSRYIGSDGVETNPEEMWSSLIAAANRAIEAGGERIEAVSLANQGESVLAWNPSTGEPSSAVIGWQDRRSGEVCQRLSAHKELVHNLTGLELDPYFSAPKMSWLSTKVGSGDVMTTTDSWILYRLCGEYVTDIATASRTLLMDLRCGEWSEDLCRIFGVNPVDLPSIVENTTVIGTTSMFGAEVPIVGLAVDQQAALFGQHCLYPGEAKCTFGTGAFLLVNIGTEVLDLGNSLSTSVAWRHAGITTYCVDGQVYTAGAALDWLVRVSLLKDYEEIDVALGESHNREVFLPALAGLAAPYWMPKVRAGFVGLSMDTDRYSLVAAVVEGIASNVATLAKDVESNLGAPLKLLRCDGGMTRSAGFMQLQADLLGVPVEVSSTPHATALGVAAMGRLGLGETPTPEAAMSEIYSSSAYQPMMPQDEAEERLARFARALNVMIDYEESDVRRGNP